MIQIQKVYMDIYGSEGFVLDGFLIISRTKNAIIQITLKQSYKES